MGRLYRRKHKKGPHKGKLSPTFWGDYTTPSGKRKRHSLRTSDREVARARLRSAELGATDNAASGPIKSLAQAIDDMTALKRESTRGQYQVKALHLLRVLGTDIAVNELTADQVANYIAQRTREKAVRHTLHKELVVLRQTLKEAKRRDTYRGRLDIVPAWKAEYTPRTRFLTRPEFDKLIAAARPKRRTWLMLQVFTSANLSEVSAMGWEHIDMDARIATVPGRKRTSRYRRVPIGDDLLAYLKTLDRDQPLHEPWKSPNHALRRLCTKAGIPNVSTNDLRRTFGSWLKQAGVDSLVVAHLMGHNSTTMVDRVYGKLSAVTYEDAIAKLTPELPNQRRGTPASRGMTPTKKARK